MRESIIRGIEPAVTVGRGFHGEVELILLVVFREDHFDLIDICGKEETEVPGRMRDLLCSLLRWSVHRNRGLTRTTLCELRGGDNGSRVAALVAEKIRGSPRRALASIADSTPTTRRGERETSERVPVSWVVEWGRKSHKR